MSTLSVVRNDILYEAEKILNFGHSEYRSENQLHLVLSWMRIREARQFVYSKVKNDISQ